MNKEQIKEQINYIETKILDILTWGVFDSRISFLESQKTELQKSCQHEETEVINGIKFCSICHKDLS